MGDTTTPPGWHGFRVDIDTCDGAEGRFLVRVFDYLTGEQLAHGTVPHDVFDYLHDGAGASLVIGPSDPPGGHA